jgi:hypothetical protein
MTSRISKVRNNVKNNGAALERVAASAFRALVPAHLFSELLNAYAKTNGVCSPNHRPRAEGSARV